MRVGIVNINSKQICPSNYMLFFFMTYKLVKFKSVRKISPQQKLGSV